MAKEQNTATAKLENSTTPNPALQISPTERKDFLFTTASPTVQPKQVIGNSSPIPVCPGKGLAEAPGKNYGIPGTIIYQKIYSWRKSLGLYSVGGTPLTLGTLPVGENLSIQVFGVSPDGKWLAYSAIRKTRNNNTIFDSPSVVLLGADEKQIEHTLNLDWLKSINEPGYQLQDFVWGYWINDHLIFTLVNSKIPGDNIGVGKYYLAILDPFQGTWRTQEFDHLPKQTGFFGASFSPDLRHILYDGKGITLMEITDKTVNQLWHDENKEFTSLLAARWSPDGIWAVFATREFVSRLQQPLFLISQDGKQIKEIQNPEIGSFFKNFYWSPNGRYIAYTSVKFIENAPDKNNLLIFDAKQQAFILECPILNVDLPLPELIWSPDSSWIAISQEGEPLRLLSIATGELVDLNIDGVAVGWSDKFPFVFP